MSELNYLKSEDVKNILGTSDRKVKALFNVEGFPCVKIGGDWYVRADKFEAWMEANEGKRVKIDYTGV